MKSRESFTHDGAYKSMFSEPEMVAGLLQDFVGESFVSLLDYSTLEPWPCDFITDDLRERREDMLWRIKLRDEQRWCFIFVMLEFQSSVDTWMAVRILAYTALLYQDLIKKKVVHKGELLPPVFPLVLYNGKKAWKAAKEMAELIQPLTSRVLTAYQPHQRHYVLDEGRLSSAELQQAESISALLFRLERAQDLTAIKQAMIPILERLQSDQYTNLRRHMLSWIMRVLFPRLQVDAPVSEIHDLKELHAMLAENIDAWVKKTKMEGYAIGKDEGITESILGVLIARFGSVDATLSSKIMNIATHHRMNGLLAAAATCASLNEFEAEVNILLS